MAKRFRYMLEKLRTLRVAFVRNFLNRYFFDKRIYSFNAVIDIFAIDSYSLPTDIHSAGAQIVERHAFRKGNYSSGLEIANFYYAIFKIVKTENIRIVFN